MNKNQFLENDEIEIDLVDLFHVLLKRWWIILVAALVGFSISAGITKFAITPKYQSQAMLYVLSKTTSVTSVADLQIGTAITEDFIIIAKSKPVIDTAIANIKVEQGVQFSRQDIRNMLSVTNEEGTRILQIRAVSENPEYACWVANAVAEATATRMGDIMRTDPPTTVEMAEVSVNPISPSLMKNSVIGFLIGAMLVCSVIVIRYLMNDNIKTDEDVEKYLGEATLVMIPIVKEKRKENKSMLRKQKGENGGKKA